jgi:hypothetical protein
MQLPLWRPPLDQGQVRRPGVPRLNRSHPLAQGMVVAMVDIGGRVYDFARNYDVWYQGGRNPGALTRGQSPYGSGINWQGAIWNTLPFGVYLDTGYLGQPDPESQITNVTTLSNQGAGVGFTMATAFFQEPGYTSTSGSMVFGRPGEAWENQPFLNCALTVSPTSGITGPSPTVGFLYNNSGGINQCGATGGWNNWQTTDAYSQTQFHSVVGTAVNTSAGSATTKQYANGKLVATSTGVVLETTNSSAGADNEAQLFIGSVYHISTTQSFEIFQGFVYYGYIWNRVLTQEEILELHYHPYCMFLWPEDDLWALWVGVVSSTRALIARAMGRGAAFGSPAGKSSLSAHSSAQGKLYAPAAPKALLQAREGAVSGSRGPVFAKAVLSARSTSLAALRGVRTGATSLAAFSRGSAMLLATSGGKTGLSARSSALSAARGALSTIANLVAITGAAKGIGSLSGLLSGATSLSGHAAAKGSGVASAAGRVGLAAFTRAMGQVRAPLSAIANLVSISGTIKGAGALRGFLHIPIALIGRSSAQGASNAVSGAFTSLIGTARSIGGSRGTVKAVTTLAATAYGQCTKVAAISGRVSLVAVSRAIGQARGVVHGIAPMVALAGSAVGMASGRGVMAGRVALGAMASAISSARLFAGQAINLVIDPLFVSTGLARIFLTKQKVPGMPLGNYLSPIDPAIETVTVTFDFGNWLGTDVTIISVTGVSCAVASLSIGIDPNPGGRIYGSPQITESPTTSAADAAVLQQVTDCLGGVTYLLQCTVSTSDNQELNLGTYLPCVAIN